ncbi:DUF3667 domain-containing protein [Epilithonimonas xixisoli]|uniref:Uncharacterized protein DUF3667 n=1 Tax=Epilithonimonas xixisoli TaxID=1476462 RepID=A0A4R8I346_9FLAO|nr:DUF3667 domain-containing protein [Epilithonimonas xixisoli]TDX82623.1 uncharacterized protein DUF3667 [Epilithonimonas xixisoli]
MSHGKLREEKDCLNCEHIVEEKYCPNCGQHNIHTKQPFHFLITHFIEDFTHYDGQFWGTMKNLFFKPGKLTSTYLEGKRQQFVPPVKLYIFVSFITFFLFAVFPPFDINFEGKGKTKLFSQKDKISEIQKAINDTKTKEKLTKEDSMYIAKLNSALTDSSKINQIERTLDLDQKLQDNEVTISDNNFVNRPISNKLAELQKKGYKKSEILTGFIETTIHNLPKALFIYLPIFAFILWLFHNKKRWWYFDHGIFTLHYFSFLLLSLLFSLLLYKITEYSSIPAINKFLYLGIACIFIYDVIYFFIAHKRVYQTQKRVSLIIGFITLWINYFAFLFLVIGLAFISFLMIH